MIPLIIIQGPTGAGKSQVAIQLANIFDTEIISADSRQVYRYLDIGTAKASKIEQQNTKHHLIDIIYPDEKYSAGAFVNDAEKVIENLVHRQKIPIICGGTGMYIKALTDGIFEHQPIDEDIKTELQNTLNKNGLQNLYNHLQEIDPESASNIKPQDKQRIIRALEIILATGKSIREHWEEQKSYQKYKAFNIIVNHDREILYHRINERMDKMLTKGLINEIKTILDMGYSFDSFGLNSVGYKEFAPYFAGLSSLSDCIEFAKQHSRNYAKRQITWYKKIDFNFAFYGNLFNLSIVTREIENFFYK
ncbi:MAG: tRNA (adenosine(37)-N6)-dimethylallyltransferase MiaA [Candidatus Cloacimonadales bacterium]|jgi:tRNA dimethylallyltransferase|nr:tRNA (adenosine(37)-N6)-dimethylallyltransferase MiaA [Candidatus Cloacimonadota bacterium]MDX9977654.1 tRNA (adenosine(37)-N6)-dimethylallyltransferase MiaA [Candidatus Cloacimonadales bacterium]